MEQPRWTYIYIFNKILGVESFESHAFLLKTHTLLNHQVNELLTLKRNIYTFLVFIDTILKK